MGAGGTFRAKRGETLRAARLGREGHRPTPGGSIFTLSLQAVGVCALLVVWELLSLNKGSEIVPSPWATAKDIRDNFFSSASLDAHGLPGQDYLSALLYTAKNCIVGVGLGSLGGVCLGIASKRYSLIGEIVTPVMATFGTAPIFVAAPFFLIWFGILPGAQILLVTFYTLLLMYLFSRRAADNVAVRHLEYALTLGSTRAALLRRVYLPGAIPELIGGFRISLAGAWGLEVIAELLGAQQGIGFLISFYSPAYFIQGMLSLVVIVGLLAVCVDRAAVLGASRLTTWMEAETRGR
jgi:ABC-type nitrate/sulfonate/bicarbonate transport system permease component